jgi:uncharacterized protein
MTRVFADTFYFLAIINAKDSAHPRAVSLSQSRRYAIVTTYWVLVEVGNALAATSQRRAIRRLLDEFRGNAHSSVVPVSQSQFDKGAELFDARPDKSWSMTDCISFAVMKEYGLRAALTADHHFEQAGFEALLK